MRKFALLACCLLLLFSLLAEVRGLQSGKTINSFGAITYLMPDLVIKRYAQNSFFGNASAEAIAKLLDMGQVGLDDAEKIQQVHVLRPDFKALLYRNIRDIYNYSTAEWKMALDNNWFLKNQNGQLVYSKVYPTEYFVDIGNQEYQEWVANWIKEKTDQYGFDGVFADISLAAWASEYFWGQSSTPMNPRTGVPWTNKEVRQALIEVHKKIKNAIGSKLLLCNGIYDGYRFWDRRKGYAEILSNSSLDGILSEGLWYHNNGAWISEQYWLNSLNFIVFLQDNFLKGNPGRFYVPMCKLYNAVGNSNQLAQNCSEEQMAMYAFASTLLGVKINQNYLCLSSDVNFTIQVIQPLYNIEVGSPVNDYYIIANTHVYARDFSKVKVLVNPTSDSYVIDLQGTYKTLSGQLVSEITMEEHTATILIRTPLIAN